MPGAPPIDRLALADTFIARAARRDAFSEPKNTATLGIDPVEAMRSGSGGRRGSDLRRRPVLRPVPPESRPPRHPPLVGAGRRRASAQRFGRASNTPTAGSGSRPKHRCAFLPDYGRSKVGGSSPTRHSHRTWRCPRSEAGWSKSDGLPIQDWANQVSFRTFGHRRSSTFGGAPPR